MGVLGKRRPPPGAAPVTAPVTAPVAAGQDCETPGAPGAAALTSVAKVARDVALRPRERDFVDLLSLREREGSELGVACLSSPPHLQRPTPPVWVELLSHPCVNRLQLLLRELHIAALAS